MAKGDQNCTLLFCALHMQTDDQIRSWLQSYNMQVWGAVQVITQAFTFHPNLTITCTVCT